MSQARAPIRKVLVVAKIGPPEGPELARELGAWLGGHDVEVLYDAATAEELGLPEGASRGRPPAGTDLAIVAGGDGTLLAVARSVGPLRIPILGINLGSLGFLTELQPDERFSGLQKVLDGDYTIEERQTLRVRHSGPGHEDREFSVLNDAVVTKSALARMIGIGVRSDGLDVAVYPSDGLIVSTPTGSTAYNLSAGGPVLDPRMQAFVLTPICPHGMTYRPLVVPGSVSVDVFLEDCEGEDVFLTLDGQIGFPFRAADTLTIESAPQPVRLVRVAGRGFFQVLRRKLRWGER